MEIGFTWGIFCCGQFIVGSTHGNFEIDINWHLVGGRSQILNKLANTIREKNTRDFPTV